MTEAGELSGELARRNAELKPRLDVLRKRIEDAGYVVAVLGPGATSSGYLKRQQIREALEGIGGISVYFPEDQEFMDAVRAAMEIPFGRPVIAEMVQLDIVDLIMALEVLEGGQGVKEEVAILSLRAEGRQKLIDLLPREYEGHARTTFPGLLRAHVQREYYGPEEYENCDLATQRCTGLVRERRLEKWFWGR